MAITIVARDANTPRIAAHFAVLNEATCDIRFNVDLDIFAAIRTCHDKLVVHRWNKNPGIVTPRQPPPLKRIQSDGFIVRT
jgi:hypothetical protein